MSAQIKLLQRFRKAAPSTMRYASNASCKRGDKEVERELTGVPGTQFPLRLRVATNLSGPKVTQRRTILLGTKSLTFAAWGMKEPLSQVRYILVVTLSK